MDPKDFQSFHSSKKSGESPVNLNQITYNINSNKIPSIPLLIIPPVSPKSSRSPVKPNNIPIFAKDSMNKSLQIHWKKVKIVDNVFSLGSTEFSDGEIFKNTSIPSFLTLILLRPELLMRNFTIKSKGDTIYFWLCNKGIWQDIALDDTFPYTEDDLYAFTHTTNENSVEPYIMLLEKALSQYMGSYERLYMENSLNKIVRTVIGVPIEKLYLGEKHNIQVKENNNKEDIQEYIKTSFYRGFLLYYTCGNDMIRGKTFLLIDIKELKDDNNDIIRFYRVKAQNTMILNKLKDLLGLSNDGEFEDLSIWLNFTKISYIFYRVNICKFHENYIYQSYVLNKAQTIYKFYCQNNIHLYITFTMTPKAAIRFFLIKSVEKDIKIELIKGDYTYISNITYEEYLEAGEYSLYIECQGNTHGVFCMYSSTNEYAIEEITHKKEDFAIEMIFKDIAINSIYTRNQQIYAYGDAYNEPRVRCISDVIYGVLYIYYVNQGKRRFHEKASLMKPKNFILFNGKNLEDVVLQPNEDMIFLYKQELFEINLKVDYVIHREKTKFDNDILPFMEENAYLGFNSNVHNDKILIKPIEKLKENCGKPELVKIMKEHGNMSHRMWKEDKIEVYCYTLMHEEGVVLLYTNYTYFPYEENIFLEVENLEIMNINEENVVRFQLEPYTEYLVFLNRINENKPFSFKTKCYYKYYPEK